LGEPFEAQKYIRKEISESASINLSNDSIMNNFEWKNIETKIFCCKSVFQELKLKSLFLILKGNILY
ncbi:TPA: D-alanine--D-alanine ligase, partial [Streptococcus suis]